MDIRQCVRDGLAQDSLPVTVGSFSIESVLRWLPGRRLVANAMWRGDSVIVKFFAPEAKGLRSFTREAAAIEQLHAYGVAAPKVLAAISDASGAYLVLEKLVGVTALEYYQSAIRESRPSRVRELVEWVRGAQEEGVIQKDIHLGNFFLADGVWYMLDASECRFGPLSRATKRRNLAALIAQFYPMDVTAPDRYFTAMGSYSRVLDAERRSRYMKILKKTQRDCSEFAIIDVGNIRGMCRRESLSEVRALLQGGLDPLIEQSAFLKDGGSATVAAAQGTNWVIKRYNIKSTLHWLKRQWGRTRARNAWLAGYFLRAIGVKTPLPIAFFEEKRGPFIGRAWIITQSISGVGLDQLPIGKALPPSLAQSLSDLFVLMRLLGFSHGDMKASNFIVDDEHLSVIDLDAFRFSKGASFLGSREVRDERRLLRNWQEGDPIRDSVELAVNQRR